LKAHSTQVAGYHDNPQGDDRYYNNLFGHHADLSKYDSAQLSVQMDGNVFLDATKPSRFEKDPLLVPDAGLALKLVEKSDGTYLGVNFDRVWIDARTRKLITTDLLGKTAVAGLPYEQPDGEPIQIRTDYFGKERDRANPSPGPFENPGTGLVMVKVW
jgi:alpha-N-arabinofuranosidase